MRKRLILGCALLAISLLALPLVGCAKALTLTISEPRDGAAVTASPVATRAYVSDSKATVWVNDTPVTVTKTRTGGYVTTNIDLNEGENTIKVVAARGKPDKWKDVIERAVTVTYTPK